MSAKKKCRKGKNSVGDACCELAHRMNVTDSEIWKYIINGENRELKLTLHAKLRVGRLIVVQDVETIPFTKIYSHVVGK